MKYIRGTTDFYIEEDTVLSLGKFDGIHRGHELLLEHLSAKKECGLSAVIFTFDIPPRRNVSHVEAKVLTTNEEKRYMFEHLGMDYLVECPFTTEIMQMEPEQFIEKLVRQLHVRCIVAGADFHFGHNRAGDAQTLRECAARYGYEVIVIGKKKEGERDISSTFVREEIEQGHIGMANRLLGYRYFVTGVVAHGNQIGRQIGIPTINQLPPEEKLLPPNGVYVTEVYMEEQKYRGVTNVGRKPTVGVDNPVGVETHLLDFREDVYGRMVTVEFLSRIRGEQKFPSVDALREQMMSDIAFARAYFNGGGHLFPS